MATQRAGKGSSDPSQKKNGTVTGNENSEESSVKQDRQSKKAKVLKEQQERNAKIRWALVAVLLVVAVIGLYCYFSYYYQSTELQGSKTRPTNSKTPSTKQKPRSEKASKEKPKKEKPSGDKQKQTDKKQKPSKKKPKREPEDKGRSEEERMEELKQIERLKKRVLRQPTLGSDPDRPHILDVITGDNLLVDGNYQEALERFNAILSQFPQSPRAQLGKGLTLSKMAEEKRSNKLMDSAIDFFKLAGLESIIASDVIREAALVALVDHAQMRNKLPLAVRAMEKLIEIRSDQMTYANQLGMLFFAEKYMHKAKTQFQKSIKNFENNHFGRAQLGYILYTEKKYEKALPLLMDGIRMDENIRKNGLFYNYAGDALSRLNRSDEAFALYGEAVALDVFPSVWQRSLANEPGLEASPWWSVDNTGYMTDITRIEKAMETITSEALAIFDATKMIFRQEAESPHYVLFTKGKKNLKNCQRTPKTCALLETFPEAAGCKRGTIKFSSMPPQAHVPPHVGATNTKLQVVVGLDLDPQGGLQIRMGEEKKVLGHRQIGVIDDSFEKEVWYMGEVPAVYLTVDVWHPDLSEKKRRHLGPL